MGLEEDLAAAIEAAQEERKKEEDERSKFESDWQGVRKSDLLPTFQGAAKVLKQKLGSGRARLHNGSILLEVALDGHKHTLTFQPDKKENIIRCFSTLEGDEGETFTVEGLTAGTLRHKLLEFAASVTRGRWEQRSAYSDRGLLSF